MNQKTSPKPIIIGIDPGTKITGYGIISIEGRCLKAIEYGCVRPPVAMALSSRYRIIFDSICQLIEKFSPTALAIETQFIDKNPASAIKLGMARGMAILAAALREIPIFEYAPMRAKQAVVGNGKASKVQVQKMVKDILRLSEDPKPEDAADALAIAICHANTCQMGTHLDHRI